MTTIQVTCNSCGKEFDVDPRKAGCASPCPNCHARVDVPDDAGAWPVGPVVVASASIRQRDISPPQKSRPPAPPATISLSATSSTVPAASPSVAFPPLGVAGPRQQASQRHRAQRVSRSDFFGIASYWTPRIVRATWGFVVCLAALASLAVFAIAVGFVWLGSPAMAAIAFFGGILAVWLLVYWYRITCEFIIVVFDIAETLAEIRNDLRNRP